jgi:predicted short-subunit dehydrogenase-like oxidoreductase (DUF2520 family)
LDVVLAGPGRAGTALALCLVRSGHRVVGVVGRRPEATRAAAEQLGAIPVAEDDPLPAADLLVVAVRDDAITEVAERLAGRAGDVPAVVHLSGATSVKALDALHPAVRGSFHPLQTLPTPEAGAARLAGAWIAVTAEDEALAETLCELAASIGAHPFRLADEAKTLYHAAAAAAANFPLGSFAMAERLFASAGVPFEAARPLVEAVVGNAFELGPTAALTGPIARGDLTTVAAHRAAVAATAPELEEDFVAMARAIARVAGRSVDFAGVLR